MSNLREMFMQMLYTQNMLIEALAKKMDQSSSLQSINAGLTSENLANVITEFTYDADAELTFESWDIFTVDCALWEDTDKCLQVRKTQSEDSVTYAGRINLEAERFKLKDLSMGQFKCLPFVSGLQSATDTELRNRILSQIENSADLTLHNITEERQRIENIKMDSALIAKGSDYNTVNRLQVSPNKREAWNAPINPKSRPPTACWKCGNWNFVKYSPYADRICHVCGKKDTKT
ncbi:unnamed protein product [Echinostoma caproni]|uniref:RanBP2-type domain-containing protein n=1 Tax=Echinostoma caproni TaxID=27848 RepID=A0A183BGS3_9TREM|nr:unnamed protein product [Echinostoma caproni]